jgi:hypothetical protein
VGDVRTTLATLLPLLQQKRDGAHLAQAREHYGKARKALDDLAVGSSGKGLIHPQQIAKAISEQAAEDDRRQRLPADPATRRARPIRGAIADPRSGDALGEDLSRGFDLGLDLPVLLDHPPCRRSARLRQAWRRRSSG